MREYGFHYDLPRVADKYATELHIQVACRRRVEMSFRARMIAIPNGTFIASRTGRGKARAEGLSKGFPDCLIIGFGPNAGRTAYAEIKAGTFLKAEQEAWLTWLTVHGFDAGCFRSQDTLAAFLTDRGWK